MALADELAYMTATQLTARIRRRELSPVEVIDAFIERIQARNPSLNALVYLGFDDARQRAREAEQALVSGAELGLLHGVPTAIKDLFDFTPGWPATFGGIRALKDFTPDISCAFAERIQRAGAIVLGKTNNRLPSSLLMSPTRTRSATWPPRSPAIASGSLTEQGQRCRLRH